MAKATKPNDFEREVIERLARIEEQQKTIFNRLGALEGAINGNGHPGLLTRVQTIENAGRHGHKAALVIGWIITTLIAAYAALRSHI